MSHHMYYSCIMRSQKALQASRVFCCQIWFLLSKHQNNFSKIFLDEHLLDWSSSALLDSPSIMFESQIWSSGSFEERLFPEALLSLFLSGGTIFISHLLRSVYLFISQSSLDCIICLDHLKMKSHLTKTYYWRYSQVKSSHHYSYSAFHNADCVKAALQY